jgi:hypothetical protein
MNNTTSVLAMLVDDEGKPAGLLGTFAFPNVPQIGSHFFFYSEQAKQDGDLLDEDHVYQIVDVHYGFGREADSKNTYHCNGWEIWVRDLGGHIGHRYRTSAL